MDKEREIPSRFKRFLRNVSWVGFRFLLISP